MTPINLTDKFAQFHDHWNPRIIGELNDQHIKIAKIKDEFIWHRHEHEDELFIVVQGTLIMNFREKNVEVEPGQLLVVPRGVEHRPRPEGETWIIMIEPKPTLTTNDVKSEQTRKELGVL